MNVWETKLIFNDDELSNDKMKRGILQVNYSSIWQLSN